MQTYSPIDALQRKYHPGFAKAAFSAPHPGSRSLARVALRQAFALIAQRLLIGLPVVLYGLWLLAGQPDLRVASAPETATVAVADVATPKVWSLWSKTPPITTERLRPAPGN